ncbi:MAG TPA: SAM-dependent methyltransferase [Rhodanobacteraceae bacterium]|nr:SAM-dependent methyltransferase [Rhodanobacteraceae bacterium]
MTAHRAAGSLACVGLGMTLGSHLTPLARSTIEQADVVFVAASDALVEQWVARLNTEVRSLQTRYRDGVSRMQTYHDMVATILAEVRRGRQVCAAFYGHPGVFCWPAHEALRQAREEGYAARMEPGISAADCLYADLGIDPGLRGCQHLEATQLLLYRRAIDVGGWVVLWQAGVVGDIELIQDVGDAACRQLLCEVLAAHYPPGHPVIVYRAATLPVGGATVRRVRLQDLAAVELAVEDTLVLAPGGELAPNLAIRSRLEALTRAHTRVVRR